jgi:hypothetical protein
MIWFYPMLEQILGNALAVISLCVALSALGYNTWRNELTEHKRNIRQAGFEMLLHTTVIYRMEGSLDSIREE